MPYAILRFQKRKAGGVAACERHNERKKEAYKSNPDIDMERSKNNYHLIAPPKYTYKKEINRMVAEAGCRTRKDSVMMVETLITASPEFMNQLPPEEQKAYFQTALDFISERVGKQNILSAVVHMDERTPHMHLCFVPITPDNKLSAKAILGNQKSLSEWQTAYHERMSSRWNQLERGQSSMETKRKHVPTLSQAQRMKQLSQSGRLDMDTIFAIMTEEKGNQKETLKINTSKLKKYFPKNTTPKQMEETIIKLLERELQRKRNRDSR